MPLQVSAESSAAIAESLKSSGSKPSFLVVYASLANGSSWCGDCRSAEPYVNAKFANSADVVRIVYAGQRDEYAHYLFLPLKPHFSRSKTRMFGVDAL
jgi:thiol-disulfide isomerase/thioredoxin